MTGTIINTAAILIGGGIGLTATKQISPKTQMMIKLGMGGFTIFVAFKTMISGLDGGFGQVIKQLGIMFASAILGNLIGTALKLQEGSNRLGEYAKKTMAKSTTDHSHQFSEGFVTCTLLFCIGPMAILGSLQDGLNNDYSILAVKALMDGMSTMVFATIFGWGVLMSALPVLAYQGTLTLAAKALAPYLEDKALLDSVNVTGGFLLLAIALVIVDAKKIKLANYLPSLAVAPLLTWLLR